MSESIAGNHFLTASGAIQLALVLLGVIVSVATEWSKSNKVVIVVTFFVFGAAGFFATIQQAKKSSAENATSQAKLSEALTNLGNSTTQIATITANNIKLQERLMANGETISKLAKQGIDSVIGGESHQTRARRNTGQPEGEKTMTTHSNKYAWGTLEIKADFSQSSSPILYRTDSEDTFQPTPFQVVTASHSKPEAFRLVNEWLAGQN